ncbi:hypothetical protein HanPSC8_Chr08g0323791 [Helianthus annuus]|nr:hypothetical protein HanPSC8_Chr08g0323791 [Helianthus annuus]
MHFKSPCTCKNTLKSSLCRITGCAASFLKYFSKATLLCSINSCFCITWLSTTPLSGLVGIKHPRYAFNNRSDNITTSLNRLRTLNSVPLNSGRLVHVVIK